MFAKSSDSKKIHPFEMYDSIFGNRQFLCIQTNQYKLIVYFILNKYMYGYTEICAFIYIQTNQYKLIVYFILFTRNTFGNHWL